MVELEHSGVKRYIFQMLYVMGYHGQSFNILNLTTLHPSQSPSASTPLSSHSS